MNKLLAMDGSLCLRQQFKCSMNEEESCSTEIGLTLDKRLSYRRTIQEFGAAQHVIDVV
jgi:hypothetical protein